MLQSKLFYKTTKPARSATGVAGGNKSTNAESISHDLLVRAGYIDQLMAGVYTFLPLGFKVLKKIENIIRKNMQDVGGQEVLMPVLQPKENWVKTGRWDNLDILFKVEGSGDKQYAMGPTHEEVVSPLAKKVIFSYKDLPFYIFQIQTKFRDELRAKSGILRTREFLMKDLYSFHANQADLDAYYDKLTKVYVNIFKEFGIGKITYRTLASGGSFAKYSDEFQMLTDAGEDIIYICKKCQTAINKEIKPENPSCPNCKASDFDEKKAVEVGNIFKLGTKYSKPFDLKFTDRDGEDKPVLMGCYGIGLSRVMGAVVEASHDEKGIIWPENLAPFLIHLIEVEKSDRVKRATQKIYEDLSRLQDNRGSSMPTSSSILGKAGTKSGQKNNIEVLYDDRKDRSVGEKLAESDLLGLPYRIIVSEKTLAKKSVEFKKRSSNKAELIKISQLRKFLISNS